MTDLRTFSHSRRSFRSAVARGNTASPRMRSWLLQPPMRSRPRRSWAEHAIGAGGAPSTRRANATGHPVPDRPEGLNLCASFQGGALRQRRWLRALSLKNAHERTDRSLMTTGSMDRISPLLR
jgi:hypothetical protein